ncbi:MAG: hypothetical protein M1818_001644 [Claussenomyces sp. TS43310]|nr:MAG: hypothetical protein M1818_001644 [Claussenomyces sp. TS43310]
MRFLCLHGMGTSGSIFAAQTTAFRAKLDPEKYIFDFVDGPFESRAAPGIDVFFKPPHYAFWRGTDPKDVRRAHEWLRRLLDEREPYDVVVGFSQGCALISSLILYHQNECPTEPLPFKSAMLICGGVPLAIMQDLGLHVSNEAWDLHARVGRQLQQTAGGVAAEIQAIMEGGLQARRGLWDRTDLLEHDPLADFPTDRTNVFGLDFERFPEGLQIPIPTVHIYGSKDPMCPSAMQLIHFSKEDRRRVYDHGGGHDVPRTTVVSDRIVELVMWLEGMVKD